MIYVDPLFKVDPSRVKNRQAKRLMERHGYLCHLVADTDEELYDFAVRLGLRLQWGQKLGTPEAHFDLVPGVRAKALRMGARQVSQEQYLNLIRMKRGEVAAPEPFDGTQEVLEPQVQGRLL